MKKSERQQLYGEVLRIWDEFSSDENPVESLNYLLAILLWRAASDRSVNRRAYWLKRLGGDRAEAEKRLGWERIRIPAGCGIQDQWTHFGAKDLGRWVNSMMIRIEEANGPLLTGLLTQLDFACERRLGAVRDRNERLRRMLEGLGGPLVDLGSGDVAGGDGWDETFAELVQMLLKRLSSQVATLGRSFLTPPGVCRLVAKLLVPQKAHRIYDPTCGAGTLLWSLAQELDGLDCGLFGEERNGEVLLLCRLCLLLRGVDSFCGHQGDSLKGPGWVEGNKLKRFDVVVGHPPFSVDDWGREWAMEDPFGRFSWGLPPKSKGDYAFILHMIHRAEECSGRVGVIASRGVLFRKGSEAKIRRRLIEENLVDAVVFLPARVLGRSSVQGVILVFKRQRPYRDVLLINASGRKDEGAGTDCLTNREMERIIAAYRERSQVEGFSCRLSPEAIAAKEYSLEWDDHGRTDEVSDAIDRTSLCAEMDFLRSELEGVRRQIEAKLGALSQLSD